VYERWRLLLPCEYIPKIHREILCNMEKPSNVRRHIRFAGGGRIFDILLPHNWEPFCCFRQSMRKNITVKCKAIRIQAWTGPERSKKLRIPEFLNSRHSEVVRLSALCNGHLSAPTLRRRCPWYSFLLEAESIPEEGSSQWKIPMTPLGIEPATFWFVAQCLNQLRRRVPYKYHDNR
jgi:hypothetical protein